MSAVDGISRGGVGGSLRPLEISRATLCAEVVVGLLPAAALAVDDARRPPLDGLVVAHDIPDDAQELSRRASSPGALGNPSDPG